MGDRIAEPASNSMSASGVTEPRAQKSASDTVFQGILRELESQRLVPGQRLVEVDLAEHFAVGRNSVREALQRLAAEGVIELSRHKGATIRSLSLQDTLDVLDVAQRMLGLVARTAVRGAQTPAARAALRETLQQLTQAERTQQASAFAQARRRFYRLLLDMGGNRELMRLFPTLLMPVVHAQHRVAGLEKIRLADYRAIVRAVLRGDAQEAELAGSAHVDHVRDRIVATYTAEAPSSS